MVITGSVCAWVMPRALTSTQSRGKDIGLLQPTWTESVREDSLPYKYPQLVLNHDSVYGINSCLKQEWCSFSLECFACGTTLEDTLASNADKVIILMVYLITLLARYKRKVRTPSCVDPTGLSTYSRWFITQGCGWEFSLLRTTLQWASILNGCWNRIRVLFCLLRYGCGFKACLPAGASSQSVSGNIRALSNFLR